MKKFIALIVFIVALVGYGLYNKEQLAIWFQMNDHQQAAHQYWFANKHQLDDSGDTTLPFTEQVITFDYVLGEPTYQDGVYYFDTTVFINNRYRLPLFTAVEAIDGVWTVNEQATFASTGDASLKYFTQRYIDVMKNTNTFLNVNVNINRTDKELMEFVDMQLIEIRQTLLESFKTKV